MNNSSERSAQNSAPANMSPSDANTTDFTSTTMVNEGLSQQPLTEAPKLNLDDVLTRWTQIDSFQVPTSGSSPNVYHALDPFAAFFGGDTVVAKVRNSFLFRGDMEVMITASFPPGAFGMTEVTADPRGGQRTEGPISGTFHGVNCRQTDIHATIDYASATNVVLRLPWFYPYDWAENPSGLIPGVPQGGLEQYILLFWSLANLATSVPGGAATGRITVFARLVEGYELCIPIMQGKVKDAAKHAVNSLSNAGKGKARTGAVSSVANTVADVAGKLSAIPFVGGMASTVAAAADVTANIAAFFGWTRDLTPPQIMGVQSKVAANLAATDSEVRGDRAAFIPDMRLNVDPVPDGGEAEDIMAFPSLFERWVLLDSFDWATGDPQGTILERYPVAPGLVSNAAPYTTGPDAGIHLSTAGFVGFPFMRWRGDMEFCIEVVCGPLHRGTLQAYWIPFGSTTATDDPTNAAFNHIWDIKQGQKKTFRVPYGRGQAYLENEVFSMQSPIIPVGATNGYLAIRVINELQSQVADSSVRVLVWYRGCENMDFRLPRSTMVNRFATDAEVVDFVTSVRFQGLGDGEDPAEDDYVSWGVSGEPGVDGTIYPGLGVRSVRALMQKPSRIWYSHDGRVKLNASGAAVWTLPWGPIGPGSGTVDWAYFFTWYGWYAVMFAAGAWEQRLAFVGNNDQMIVGCAPCPQATLVSIGTPNYGTTLMPFNRIGTGGGQEMAIPWGFDKKFLPANFDLPIGSGNPGTKGGGAVYASWKPGTSSGDLSLFASFGDVRMVRFAQTPRIKFSPDGIDGSDTFWQGAVA